MPNTTHKKIIIIGGGASGFFAALRAAEQAQAQKLKVAISILESSKEVLRKVRISGGGRCNVTHHQFDPQHFAKNYPRGHRELLSPLTQFQAKDTVDWFAKRGVKLKVEADGRMFPITNNSQSIIDCFMRELKKLGVELKTQTKVTLLSKQGEKILVSTHQGDCLADRVLIATGSSAGGYQLAKMLGHSITELAPSLFTFKVKHPLIDQLAGTSFPSAELILKIDNSPDFKQRGPLLITHWGFSGPALLKLSAWAAREMKRSHYQARLFINWLGIKSESEIKEKLYQLKKTHAKSKLSNQRIEQLSKRFWLKLLAYCDVTEKKWSELSNKDLNRLTDALYRSEFQVTGKSRFKEEFVECGGIDLKEVHFKTMQSKICPGLYFAGEVMDIDGITGGFNFQHAWTSGWLAGSAMLTDL